MLMCWYMQTQHAAPTAPAVHTKAELRPSSVHRASKGVPQCCITQMGETDVLDLCRHLSQICPNLVPCIYFSAPLLQLASFLSGAQVILSDMVQI